MAKKLILEEDKLFDQKLIDSMKDEMQPSDEVVSSLLAKIAELDKANVSTETKVVKPVRKRVWFYATCAVASVIVLFSTFTLFGGDSQKNIETAFNNVVGDNTVVTNPSDNNEQTPVVVDPKPETEVKETTKKEETKKTDKTEKNNTQTVEKESKVEDDNTEVDEKSDDNVLAPVNPTEEVIDNAEEGNDDNSNNSDPIKETDNDESKNPPSSVELMGPDEMINVDGDNYIVGAKVKKEELTEETSLSLEVEVAPTIKVQAKALKSVSPSLMMALASPTGDDEVVLYTNADYVAENLGQLIADANIESIDDYGFDDGIGICKYSKNGKLRNYKAVDLLASVKEYLLINTEAVGVSNNYYSSASTKVEFESTTNSTGLTIYFGVSPKGYLNIKLENADYVLLNEFTFDIGQENAKAFIFNTTGN